MAQSSFPRDAYSERSDLSVLGIATGAALVFLLVAFPVVRILVRLYVPSVGWHMSMRLLTGTLELIVVTLALCDRTLTWPKLMSGRPHWIRVLAVLWLTWATIAVALSPAPLVSAIRQLEWIVHGIFGIAVCAYLVTYDDWRPRLLRYLVIGFLFYAVVITLLLLSVPDPDSYPWTAGVLGFSNVRHFGYFIAIALVAAYTPFVTRNADQKQLAAPFVILTLIYAYLAWAGGRGPYLGIVCAFAILVLCDCLPNWRRLAIMSAVALVLGAVISIPFTPADPSFGAFRFLIRSTEIHGADAFTSGRIEIWMKSIEMIREHPFFGIGPDQFRVTLGDSPIIYFQPHNGFLQTALEWGIPGGLLFWSVLMGLMVMGCRRLRRHRDPAAIVGFGLALTLLFVSTVDGTLCYAMPLSALGLAFALVFSGKGHNIPALGHPANQKT